MRNYGLFIVVTISLMLLGVSCGLSDAADAVDSTVVVTIDGSAFSPEVAVVKVGGEVVWKNKDAAPHTITADDGSFDSGTLGQGGEYRKKFTSPGTIKYSCDIHSYMSGRIEVR
jgi:plastocyanin